ncbi:MAG TPA: amidohydrolase family protein [Novosphingobium sp.]|nr:amidohydrolase family protein [Novosphingobium sp.]
MYDLLIRGGSVVDGAGSPPVTADVAVKDGSIVAVGQIREAAREVVDADGALVTPGFIDVHTHYDGQFLWDETLEPSFSHGVTTVIAGNCGVGFAPLRPDTKQQLLELMEGVEDIPGIVLDEGMDWDWRSFGDYMDRLDGRHYSMDVATHLSHAPVRLAVMGERALRHEAATPQDIAEMAQIVREGMEAGAVGFSGSRVLSHRSSTGAHVPGTFAEDAELLGLARAMGESGRGVFEIVPLSPAEASREERLAEHDRFARIAEASGRPVTYVLGSAKADPEDRRIMFEATAQASAEGLRLHPQIASRYSAGALQLLDGAHIFKHRPSYRTIAHLPVAARAEAMRDPPLRAAILAEADDLDHPGVTPMERTIAGFFGNNRENMYPVDSPLGYELGLDQRSVVLGAREGKTVDEHVYDYLTAGDGGNVIGIFRSMTPLENAAVTYEMLRNPLAICGLGDGGAHMSIICDASMPTWHLSFWGRDRKAGPRLPLELLVNQNTKRNADLYGLSDRGTIAVGQKADINVIDFDSLTLDQPRTARDLPAGGSRLLQGARGYLATIANGTVTRRHDGDTGARPGRLIRAR